MRCCKDALIHTHTHLVVDKLQVFAVRAAVGHTRRDNTRLSDHTRCSSPPRTHIQGRQSRAGTTRGTSPGQQDRPLRLVDLDAKPVGLLLALVWRTHAHEHLDALALLRGSHLHEPPSSAQTPGRARPRDAWINLKEACINFHATANLGHGRHGFS
jgi:hypothetical protein